MTELIKDVPNPDKNKPRIAMRRCNNENPIIKDLTCKRACDHDLETGHWAIHQGKGYAW